MGHVALAIFGEAGQEHLCVVKRMLPHLLTNEENVRRFHDEANISRRLSHGCIVQTLATGRVEGEPYIAQALVEGRDLAEVVSRTATQQVNVPLALWIHIVREICRGLAYAHGFEDLGLVHRDISPANIRLSFSGEVKLMDFGLAFSKNKSALTAPGAFLGRAAYMPPEQLANQPSDCRADLYALGVVLWELCSGQLFGTVLKDGKPMYAGDPRAALARAFKPSPVPPSVFNPVANPDLDALVMKAVSVAPERRFQSAADFRAALAGFVPAGFDAESSLIDLLRSLFPRDAELIHRRDLITKGRALLAGGHDPVASAPVVDAGRSIETVPVRRPSWMVLLAAGAVVVAMLTVALVAANGRSRELPVDVRTGALPASPVPPGRPEKVPASPSASIPATDAPDRYPVAKGPPIKTAPAVERRPSGPVTARPEPSVRAPLSHIETARDAFLNGDLEKALREAEAAVEDGGGAEALLVVGNVHFSRRNYRDAETAYAKAAVLAPEHKKIAERLQATREILSQH
jgi:serine/threonine-protein kinase